MYNDIYPIIGISGNILVDEGGMFPGYERAYVNDDYIKAVSGCGAVPYIIPVLNDDEIIKEQIKNIDGLIMSGGYDINPLLWGEEPNEKLGDIMPKRDTFDMKLLKYALEMKKPVLGICRGEQVINVNGGGSLYQDLSLMDGSYIKHNQKHLSSVPTHTVVLKPGSRLRNIIGKEEITVNSFHHLAVRDVAPGYSVAAEAKDGVIEAIEKDGEDFVIGVQWHPEMMSETSYDMKKIFRAFVDEALKKKSNT